MDGPRDFPNFTPGDKQSLDELRRMNELAERVNSPARFSASGSNPMGGESGIDSGGPYSAQPPIDPLFPVRVTAAEWVTGTAVVNTPGSGFVADDTITLAADRVDLLLKVLSSDSAGAITDTEIIRLGVYDVGGNPSNPQSPSATSGVGVGADFIVNLLAPSGGDPTTFYSWIEQIIDDAGTLTDLPGGRTGLTPTDPAIHINGPLASVGDYAWLRFRVAAPLGAFLIHEIENWLLAVSDENAATDRPVSHLFIVGDGGNISTHLLPPAAGTQLGDSTLQVRGSDSPTYDNITVNNLTVNNLSVSESVFFGSSSTVNFNNVTIINFPGSGSITFNGARYPTSDTIALGPGASHTLTWSVADSVFAQEGYDDVPFMSASGSPTINASGKYDFQASTQWSSVTNTGGGGIGYNLRQRIVRNGTKTIDECDLKTTLPGQCDDELVTMHCGKDHQCSPGDTITVTVWNDDISDTATLKGGCFTFHQIH